MSYLEIQLIIAASVYFMIGVGVGLGFYLASEDLQEFKDVPLLVSIPIIFVVGLLWVVTISTKLTFTIFEDKCEN